MSKAHLKQGRLYEFGPNGLGLASVELKLSGKAKLIIELALIDGSEQRSSANLLDEPPSGAKKKDPDAPDAWWAGRKVVVHLELPDGAPVSKAKLVFDADTVLARSGSKEAVGRRGD